MEVSGQLHAPAALPQEKESPLSIGPLDSRLGERQSRSGRGGEEKNSQPLPGLETQIIQPVAHRYATVLRLQGLLLFFFFFFFFFFLRLPVPTSFHEVYE
jgi:hypothetical protein